MPNMNYVKAGIIRNGELDIVEVHGAELPFPHWTSRMVFDMFRAENPQFEELT